MIYHILIVDDESAIKKGLSMLIQKALPNCVIDGTASDGAEAIELIQKSPPDIVITDIKMPVCNGLELSRFLYENYPDIRIIMLTGFADFEYAQTAIQYRVSDYLLKPTSKNKLVDAISKIQAELEQTRKKRGFLQKNSALFLEHALQEIASGSFTEEYQQKILSCWPADKSHFYCVSFQSKSMDNSEKNQIALIRGILEQQLQDHFIFRHNNAINCLFFDNQDEAHNKLPVMNFAQEIAKLSSLLYGVVLSAGISMSKDSLHDIPAASGEAHSARLSNFFTGKSISVYNPLSFAPAHHSGKIFRKELFELEKALADQNYLAVTVLIQEIFSSFRSNHITASQAKYISGQIYYILTRVLLQNDIPEVQTDFLSSLEKSTNADDLQRDLLQIVDQIRQAVLRSGKQMSQIIRNTTEYIAKHLTDDLALETIAEAVSANPSYLSRVFKKECGETLTEYITRMRIEKAKELLRLPDYFVYQVSEATGFHDPAYFSTLFKKYAGISPKEYQQKFM